MKVLIFSMTVGEGHNFLAKSMAQQFEKLGCQTKIEQVFGYDEKRVAKENKLFLWACKRIPHFYNYFWNKLRKRNPNKYSRTYFHPLKKCYAHFSKCINEFKPDIIFCVHFYASNILSKMRTKNMGIDKNIIISYLLTDYCTYPYMEFSTSIDYLITPFDAVTEPLIQRGYQKQQIIPLGMPTREEFSTPFDVKEQRKKLGIDEKFTVFSIAGGNGLGNTAKLIKNVLRENPDVNFVCINGKNKKMQEKIEKFKRKNNLNNIYNLGFVTNVYDYMKASDVVICRGGGAGVAEVLNTGRPFIIREKLILNEKLNKKMFIEEGCALGMKRLADAGKLVKKLHTDKELYKKMSEKSKVIAKPTAALDIAKFLIEKANAKNK